MPIYLELCKSCNLEFELLVLTHESYVIECPRCKSHDIEWLPSTFATQVKEPIYGSYRGSCANAFENFTLHHVRDERGKKVKVNSLKELRAAERKYNFSLDIASENKPERDEPPTHEKWAGDITRDYDWRWARDERTRAEHMASPVVNVDVGIARSKEDTLAGRSA